MLSQLVYISTRKPICTEQEIGSILLACRKKNHSLDITGVLFYSDNKFIQSLEGDAKEILALYDRIKLDTRHEHVTMISYGSIKERAFPSWQMATKKFTNGEIEFRTDISSEDKNVFKGLLSGAEQSNSQLQRLLKRFFEPASPKVKV